MASAIISDGIGMHSTMYVPEIEVIDIEDFSKIIYNITDSTDKYFLVSQLFLNDLEGETVMVMSEKSAKELTYCYGKIDNMLNPDSADDVKTCALEISNIMTSALIGYFADMTNTKVYFHPPEISLYDNEKLSDVRNSGDFQHVIIIKIVIDIDTTEIKGNMYILFKETSFDRFKAAIDYFIDNYAG